jgi:DNA replication protein DnaC
MLRRVKQSRMDNSRDAVIAELTSIDLLIIDDFALEPMPRDESRDVYQFIVERSGRAPTSLHQQSRHSRVAGRLRRDAPRAT